VNCWFEVGFTAKLTGGIHRVLRLDGVDNIGDGNASFANWSGFTQSLMAYCPEPKTVVWPTPYKRAMGR